LFEGRKRPHAAEPREPPTRGLPRDKNAVSALVGLLPAELVRARLGREGLPTGGATGVRARRLRARFDVDLVGFLNGAGVAELRALAAALELGPGTAGALRQKLWLWGAARERRGFPGVPDAVLAAVQPAPALVGGRLALATDRAAGAPLPAARAARFPTSSSWPRPVPPLRPPPTPAAEPASLDELLVRADGLLGVRLGSRPRDKGFYGQAVAALLGLARSSDPAPDWRGAVELKTVAVVHAQAGRWRLKDGPAISMRSVDAAHKLARVLWVVRVDEGEVAGAPVLSWYYQELDADLAAALERARHLRPKGGAGTRGRGWYLRRDFFDACGLLQSLNGG
jgi:hypothetical protein